MELINNSWSLELKQAIRSRKDLLAHVGLTAIEPSSKELSDFPLLAPVPYVNRIKYGDPNDPLLLQILSSSRELDEPLGFVKDPLEEAKFNPTPGIIHKYSNRVLFILSGQCAVNCRYCFRRHFPYDEQQRSRKEWLDALTYVSSHPEIKEVILSGGDPLIVNDRSLEFLFNGLNKIPHLKRVRVHTRLPLVIPKRVTRKLCDIFKSSPLRISLIWHINHPNEIDGEVINAAKKLTGIVDQFNQSVLLKGVNDNVSCLRDLSETLHDAGIQPYYLHLLDKVQGAAHFLIDDDRAADLYRGLASELPGFLLPKLAREESGLAYKTTYGTGVL